MVKDYTRHYRDLVGTEGYVTVDIRADRNPDLVVDVTSEEFPGLFLTPFGGVIFNGIIGFGVDTEAQIKAAFSNLNKVLHPGGILLVGWNERFLGRICLEEMLTELGFSPLAPIVELAENPEGHYFWWWQSKSEISSSYEVWLMTLLVQAEAIRV